MSLEIAGRSIGDAEPLFVIAEIGLNHGGSLERALAMVDAAAAAGASAVKLQTIDAPRLVAPGCAAPPHVQAESLVDFFRQFELDESAHAAVAARARARGLAFMSTPFSLEAVDVLDRVGVDAYKIASGDLTYRELIERCARTGKPLVMSTGLATLSEIACAVDWAVQASVSGLALLHCVSTYPTPADAENLRAIRTLAAVFGLPVGLSDHAPSFEAVPLAVALGASIYERHLVLDGSDTIDAAVSSNPAGFAEIVDSAARTRRRMGNGQKVAAGDEQDGRIFARRSLHAARQLTAGDTITRADVLVVRPATGLAPSRLVDLIGARVARDVAAGEPFVDRDLLAHGSRREVA